MWVEKLTLENIKCFDNCEMVFGTATSRYKWVTLLGENGGGKSTALQALGLLLAGPEGATKLLSSPEGWLKNETHVGKISLKIHQGKNDPGKFGDTKVTKTFAYNYLITGSKRLEIGKDKKIYTEPTILEGEVQIKHLSWLRENALLPKGEGWFAAGYGAFRRLTRKSGQILLPSIPKPLRYTNFSTQFEEDEPLTSFEQWLVYLDYRISKNSETGKIAEKQRTIGIEAIDTLLPEGSSFEKIDDNGRIWFNVNGVSVTTLALSDGYRSILALAGDLIWRLIEAFPRSRDPLKEEGVVLIDELDIHLHPTWQRVIASWLQSVFPNIQFIIATHSPLIAAGAGKDAVTYRVFKEENGNTAIEKIENIAFQDVDSILQSRAFGLISTYSPEAEATMDTYLELKNKPNKSSNDEQKLKQLQPLAATMLSSTPLRQSDEDVRLQQEVIEYVKKSLAK
jgi:predicted ATP-binding protein involved in virulence